MLKLTGHFSKTPIYVNSKHISLMTREQGYTKLILRNKMEVSIVEPIDEIMKLSIPITLCKKEENILNDLDLMEVLKGLESSTRMYNLLKHLYEYKNVKTAQQLIEFHNDNDINFLKIRGCGRRTLIEIIGFIESLKERK